jgi:hypothetical protein
MERSPVLSKHQRHFESETYHKPYFLFFDSTTRYPRHVFSFTRFSDQSCLWSFELSIQEEFTLNLCISDDGCDF